MAALESPSKPPAAVPAVPTATTSRGQQIEKEIEAAKHQLSKATPTMKQILTDKINLLQSKLERAEAQKDSENE
jgi:hypothetical protein